MHYTDNTDYTGMYIDPCQGPWLKLIDNGIQGILFSTIISHSPILLLQIIILSIMRGRFPRVFGEEFCDKFSDEFSESPNLVMN